jgi:hypothetical protein
MINRTPPANENHPTRCQTRLMLCPKPLKDLGAGSGTVDSGRLENKMKQALALSPDIDSGWPLRLLGAPYLKAPAWPNGIAATATRRWNCWKKQPRNIQDIRLTTCFIHRHFGMKVTRLPSSSIKPNSLSGRSCCPRAIGDTTKSPGKRNSTSFDRNVEKPVRRNSNHWRRHLNKQNIQPLGQTSDLKLPCQLINYIDPRYRKGAQKT